MRRAFLDGGQHSDAHQSGKSIPAHPSASSLQFPQALSGLGGVGKTQFAVEYSYRFRNDYKFVFWVEAATQADLVAGYVSIARDVRVVRPDETDQNQIVESVRQWLETHSDWLLILNNADVPQRVKPFMPRQWQGHLLLTTRAQSPQEVGVVRPFEVGVLSNEEASAFILKRTGLTQATDHEREQAAQLVSELGALPLALEQAAAYIVAKRTSIERYLASYRQRRLELLERQVPLMGDYAATIATTWEMNFREVEGESSASLELLRASVFLPADNMPLEVLSVGASYLGPALEQVLAKSSPDSLAIYDVLEPLTRYSLIQQDDHSYTFSIHRLVQDVVHSKMSRLARREQLEHVLRTANASYPHPVYEHWSFCERLLPFALHVLDAVDKSSDLNEPFGAPNDLAMLSGNVGVFLESHARLDEAIHFFERAASLWESILGPEHLDVAAVLNNLGEAYTQKGDLAKAEDALRRALSIKENQPEVDENDVAITLVNMGLLLDRQGKEGEAILSYKRALGPMRTAPSSERWKSVHALNNLAMILTRQGKFIAADILRNEALTILQERFGPDDVRLASVLNGMGYSYDEQGDLDAAKPLYERALRLWQQEFGSEHPDVAMAINNLGWLLFGQGDYGQAGQLLQQALAIREKVYPANHPMVIQSLRNLALFLYAMGKLSESERLEERAIAQSKG